MVSTFSANHKTLLLRYTLYDISFIRFTIFTLRYSLYDISFTILILLYLICYKKYFLGFL